MMKKVRILILFIIGLFSVYYAISWGMPYAISAFRGGDLEVKFSGHQQSTAACVNGGRLVYPKYEDGYSHLVLYSGSGRQQSLQLKTSENYFWCGNKQGESPVIISLSHGDRGVGIAEYYLNVYRYVGGSFEKTTHRFSKSGLKEIYFSDWNYDRLIFDATIIDDQVAQSALLSMDLWSGEVSVPVVRVNSKVKAGVLVYDGFLFVDKSKVFYYDMENEQYDMLGNAGIGRPYFDTSDDVVAWSGVANGRWFIEVFEKDGEKFYFDGLMPNVSGNRITRLVEGTEVERVVLNSTRSNKEKTIIEAKKIRNPIYYDGKIYWQESIHDIGFPFRFIYELLMGDPSNSIGVYNESGVLPERIVMFSKKCQTTYWDRNNSSTGVCSGIACSSSSLKVREAIPITAHWANLRGIIDHASGMTRGARVGCLTEQTTSVGQAGGDALSQLFISVAQKEIMERMGVVKSESNEN